MVKYQQLLHARALLLHGNFRKAAKAENITQPAFSRSIATLEDSLGVQLFNRQRGKVTATDYGEILRKHSSIILDAALEFEREIKMFNEMGVGELTIALAPYPGEISGNIALGKLISQYPEIRCKATTTDWHEVEKLVVEHKADLGFAEISEALKNKKMKTELTGQHRFVFFCRSQHPLVIKNQVSKEDFFTFPLVSIKLAIRVSPFIPGRLFPKKNSAYMLPSIEIQDLPSSRQIIMESDAFSAAAPLQIQRELEANEFSIIPFHEPWMKLNYGFIYERDRLLSPAALEYMDIVKVIEKDVALRNEKLLETYLKH